MFLLDFVILLSISPCPTCFPSASLNIHSTSTNTSTVILVTCLPVKLLLYTIKRQKQDFSRRNKKENTADVFDS